MYDFAIIGGGPGGYSAALRAAELGYSVVLFEQDFLGGTCLNRGCVPTKFLEHVSREYSYLEELETYGIHIVNKKLCFSETLQTKNSIIMQLRTNLKFQMEEAGIIIIEGTAEIKNSKVVTCNNVNYEVCNIIIATGAQSVDSPNKNAINSDIALELDHVPDSISILGGGVVAVEFAEIYKGLGADVSIYIRGERILRKWDRDIAVGLTQSMKKNGIKIYTKCSQDTIENVQDEIVISALGRKANLNQIPLDYIDVGENGGIITDIVGRTRTRTIYAIGDVVEDSPMLAHVAMEQGKRVVDYLKNGIYAAPSSIISCIYTNPEIASVGLTELQAREKNISIVVGKQTMYSNARTLIATRERGFIKIIVDKNTRRIVGAHLMCDRATDIISEFAMAIDSEFTVDDMLSTTYPHPSYCEEIGIALEKIRKKLEDEI